MKSGSRFALLAAITTLTVGVWAIPADAQYFGRNQVQYERFDFEVL